MRKRGERKDGGRSGEKGGRGQEGLRFGGFAAESAGEKILRDNDGKRYKITKYVLEEGRGALGRQKGRGSFKKKFTLDRSQTKLV